MPFTLSPSLNTVRQPKRFKSLLNGFALTSALTLTGLGWADSAEAGQWHRNGDTLIYSGSVTSYDPIVLSLGLARAAAQGITIRRVVFRNSGGGSASGGVGMGQVIREANLDTVWEGGCYSACADAFVGGVNRFIADYYLPQYSDYSANILGIHGAALNGVPVADQDHYIEYYREMLGTDGFAIAGTRIIQAHYELTQQSGFLRYFDPRDTGSVTRFCPTGNQTATGNCTAYPTVSAFSDTIITSPDHLRIDDKIFVTDTVNGQIATGFENSRFYRNDQAAFGFRLDEGLFDLEDRFGVIAITPGGRWNLNASAAVPYLLVDGGRLDFGPAARFDVLERASVTNGGILAVHGSNWVGSTVVNNGGLMAGYGGITGAIDVGDGGTLLPQGLEMKPYLNAPINRLSGSTIINSTNIRQGLGRFITLEDGSNLGFTVAPSTTAPQLTLVQARYFILEEDLGFNEVNLQEANRKSVLSISKNSTLRLNFESGFYKSRQEIPLVSSTVDSTPLTMPSSFCEPYIGLYCKFVDPDELNTTTATGTSIVGRFKVAKYLGDESYSVDLTQEGAVFQARPNSLLTFTINQSSDGISVTANPAFEDVTIFRNKASGNGLGEALKAASWDNNTRLGPVLGALQFTDRNVARRQASNLRGDGHSSLRLVSRSIIDQFSDALFNARQQIGGAAVNNPLAVAETLTLPGDRSERMGMGGGYVGTATLVPDVEPTPRSPYDLDAPTQVFATGFGQMGVLHGQHRISRLEYNGFGTLIGASRELNSNARLGAAVGYGQTRTNARPVNTFNADTDTLLGAVFADFSHARGALSVQAGYAQITHDTTRNILDIEGLETPSTAEYDNHAYFARLEHGLDLGERHGAQITLLAPVIDYVNLQDARVNENGNSPANLRIQNETFESLRAGLGLQVERQIQLGDAGVTPYARVVYQRELWDREATSTNRFRLATQLPFDAVSRELGEDSVEWNLGLRSTTRNQNLNLAVEYQGRAIKGETGHGAQVSLNYRF